MKDLRMLLLLLLLAFPLLASGQSVELGGGYAHISGDGGVDGFNAAAAMWVTDRVAMAFDYDSAWDTSQLGSFALTQSGTIVSKSHLQNFIFGPRISFAGLLKDKKTFLPRLWPFAEIEIGYSHLGFSLSEPS